MTKYAFLYSGDGNKRYNHSRYANDLGFAYKVLTEKYHYLKQNIIVIDVFTFVVSNHGGNNGELFSWDEKIPIQMPNIITALNKIKCKKIILMGQCYGGNYTYPNIENSIVVSANIPNAVSYCKMAVSDGKYIVDKVNEYDEFLYNFFSYCNGSYPCGKPLRCTKKDNTVLSAYEYSKNNDFLCNGISLGGVQYKETPCIKDNIGASFKNLCL